MCWPEAWIYIGGCIGSYSPTATPSFDPAYVEGCPEEYDDGSEYEEGDKVSVTAAGEDYGKIYECKGWPASGHCGNEAYSPRNSEKLCNGDVCWPDAWTYVGGCIGTITPTATPTFDEDGITGCPEEYETGAKYGENDIVSIKGTGETVGKIYQCKPWPLSNHCQLEAYKPVPGGIILHNGEPLWRECWNYVGGCTGTHSPTATPTFDPANVEGCPEEFEVGVEYKEGDKMSITAVGEDYARSTSAKAGRTLIIAEVRRTLL